MNGNQCHLNIRDHGKRIINEKAMFSSLIEERKGKSELMIVKHLLISAMVYTFTKIFLWDTRQIGVVTDGNGWAKKGACW